MAVINSVALAEQSSANGSRIKKLQDNYPPQEIRVAHRPHIFDPLSAMSVPVVYPKNRTIFYEGDQSEFFFKVLSGTVRLCRVTEDGRRQIFAFPTTGDIFGWSSEPTYTYSTEAVTAVRLEKYHRSEIMTALRSNPQLAYQVLMLVADQLAAAQKHLFVLGRMSASERIAAFLMERPQHPPGGGAGKPAVSLSMTRKDIADYLGLTIETVSRTMNVLKRKGLISFNNVDCVELRKGEALENLATGG